MNDEITKKKTPLDKVATIIGIVLLAVLIPLLSFNLILIIKGYVNEDEVPSVFGISPMIVQSGSMETEIYTGDIAIIKKVDPSTLKVDDIICFKEKNYVVTHRIIGIEEDSSGNDVFVTKGDNNLTEDLYAVDYDSVVGIYIGRVPKLGDFAMFIQKPAGMLVLVGVPIILFVVYDLLRRKLNGRKEDDEKARLEAEVAELRRLAASKEEKKEE